MVRTQISLEEDAYREAKAAARRQGVSLAEFLRRAVAAALGPPQPARRSWMRYAGAVSSGDPGSSQSVNEVVYGRGHP